jgi:opacity protein-like surface antigen
MILKGGIMKKIYSVIGCLFMLLILPGVSLSAGPAPGPYVSVQMGGTLKPDSEITGTDFTGKIEYKPGFSFTAAGGYNFGMFRIEGELGYQRNDMDKFVCKGGDCTTGSMKGNIYGVSGMANAYIDLVNSSPFTPYIGGGVGAVFISADFDERSGTNNREDNTVFAYQGTAGLAYAINPHMIIDLKYRYFGASDVNLGDVKASFASHNVFVGFRYNF